MWIDIVDTLQYPKLCPNPWERWWKYFDHNLFFNWWPGSLAPCVDVWMNLRGWLSFVLIFGHLSPNLQQLAKTSAKNCSVCWHHPGSSIFVLFWIGHGWERHFILASWLENASIGAVQFRWERVEAAAMCSVGSWEVVSLSSLTPYMLQCLFLTCTRTDFMTWMTAFQQP